MTLILQFPTNCGECGGRMSIGTEYIHSTTNNGKSYMSHPVCPERKQKAQNLPQRNNPYSLHGCEGCGETYGARGPGPCPVCGGKMVALPDLLDA